VHGQRQYIARMRPVERALHSLDFGAAVPERSVSDAQPQQCGADDLWYLASRTAILQVMERSIAERSRTCGGDCFNGLMGR